MTEPIVVTAEHIAAAQLKRVLANRSGRDATPLLNKIADAKEGDTIGYKAVRHVQAVPPVESAVAVVDDERQQYGDRSRFRLTATPPPTDVNPRQSAEGVVSGREVAVQGATAAVLARVMRRRPLQRGAAKITAIIEATETLLNDFDYDDITAARIVELAGVPIGSFYQYFPDKRSVVHALALRRMEDFFSQLDGQLSSHTWQAAVSEIVDLYFQMAEHVPILRVMDLGSRGVFRFDPAVDHSALMGERLAELLGARFPVYDRNLPFMMAAQLLRSMAMAGAGGLDELRPQLIESTKELLVEILRPAFRSS